MRKIQLANNEYYHIYNRSVEKRIIFQDQDDHLRFIHDLFEFNDRAPAGKFFHFSETEPPNVKTRELLVEIVCFCLMPNHFHLILRQKADNGISLFMQKLGTGYTTYFNKKYDRSGVLFQGAFKSIYIETDEYLTHLSRYIHLNPIELIDSNWKTEGIGDWRKANNFLESYQWSSYPDYLGNKNFPSLTNRNLLLRIFNGLEKYKKFINEWMVKDSEEINFFGDRTSEK